MSKLEKLIRRILREGAVSYDEAEALLRRLEFEIDVRGSHHIFREPGYPKTVSLKRRRQLLRYQLRGLIEVLQEHGH